MWKGLTKFILGDRREFDTFQLEVSTYSSLECQVCPQEVFGEKWTFQNMPLETFHRVRPHFPRTRWVSFGGWGDPLENEHLAEMIGPAKQAGCRTHLRTNGFLLGDETSRRLLAAGLDLVTVSLDLATQAVQRSLEQSGSDLRRILDQAGNLIKMRNASGGKKPAVRLSVPMTRLNMAELPGLVSVAAGLGAEELIIAHLDYLPEERWNILRTFYHESPTEAFEGFAEEIRRRGKKEGLAVEIHPLRAREVPVCEPDPPQRVFISVDGSVAPCPYLRIPKKGDIPRIFMNQEHTVPQVFFGNVNREDFLEVWNRESYRSFRKIFEDRRKAALQAAQLMDALTNFRPGAGSRDSPEPPPPLSESCRTCYKAYGI